MTRREVLLGAAGALAMGSLAACGAGTASSTEQVVESAPQSSEAPVVSEPVVTEPVPAEPASELARMFDAGEVGSIRLIGDSITAGWACDGYGPFTDTVIYATEEESFLETGPEVSCWANDFRAYAAERGVASFVNAGIPGAKMQWLAEDPEAWILESADVIFVMLGTNDAVYYTPEEFRANAEAGLSAVAAACKLMVVLSPPTNERTDSVNLYGPEVLDEVLTGLCEERGWQHLSLLNAVQLYTDDFNDDQVHPTSSGQHKLWERIRTEYGL